MASTPPSVAPAVNNPAVGGSAAPVKRKKKVPKNAPGNKSDPAWEYGISVGIRKIRCKLCAVVFTGSVYRLKHHLACTNKDVRICNKVSDDLKLQMLDQCKVMQDNLVNKSTTGSREKVQEGEGSGKRPISVSDSHSQVFKRRCMKQTTINSHYKKHEREAAHNAVARFFYNNAIPFNVARSEEYKTIVHAIAKHGEGYEPPSYNDIRVKYLKEQVKLTHDSLEEHRKEWARVGCTIMTDGWTDRRKRSILNFLVNSPKGTVFLRSIDASDISKTGEVIYKLLDEIVEEVGEKNVIQVVTDNAANCVAAGEMLMKKRKHLYWTPCAAHCIDLMLEDLMRISYHAETIPKGKKITTFIYARTSLISILQKHTDKRELIRPGATRFATSYLTLACLHENKDSLIRMFTSKEWKSNRSAKTKDGQLVEQIVLDIGGFWKNVVYCLKGALPLVKVLRLVDSDQKPAMGFIYEAMDAAKEEIQNAFRRIKGLSYKDYWAIIDDRWNNMLHRPLHAAAYFLNPQMQYGNPKFKADLEVRKGVMCVLEKLVADKSLRGLIDRQMDSFRKREGIFGCDLAKENESLKQPADWWESYGVEYPELQNFAIRILSLTCSSSGCERNWSAFEMVHTKKRNRLKQKKMNDVVYVMVNSRLAKKKKERKAREFEDLVSDCEWVSGDDNENGNTNAIEVEAIDEDTDEGEPNFDKIEASQVPIYEDVAERIEQEEGNEANEDGGEEEEGSEENEDGEEGSETAEDGEEDVPNENGGEDDEVDNFVVNADDYD